MKLGPLLSLLVVAVAATPTPDDGIKQRNDCLTDAEANALVTSIKTAFECVDPAFAKKVLTPDFHSYSYSILRPGCGQLPPGNLVASSRDQFVQQQQAQQGPNCANAAKYQTQKVWHGCDSVTFWWTLSVTDPKTNTPYLYAGIDAMDIEKGSHRIEADYSEFSV